MSDKPRVTWLLPVFNGMPYLPQTLASIAAQTYGNHEVLAWDNGSTDGSVEELQRWIPTRLAGTVVTSRPLGIGAALARMVQISRTELCARIDADDVNEPDRLARQVERMLADEALVLIGSNVQRIDEGGAPLGVSGAPVDDVAIRWALRFCNPMKHPTVLFRRRAVLAAGNYRDIKPGQDYDLWLRMARVGKMANLPEPLVRYRVHDRSITRTEAGGSDAVGRQIVAGQAYDAYPGIGIAAGLGLRALLMPGSSVDASGDDLRRHRRLAIATAQHLGLPKRRITRSPLYRRQRRRLWRSRLRGSATARAVWRLVKPTPPPMPCTTGSTMPGLSASPSGDQTITILTKLFWPRTFGGLERKALRMADQFAARPGLKVRVITETADGLPAREVLPSGVEIIRRPALAVGWRWRWADRLRGRWWRRALDEAAEAGPIIAFSPMAGAAVAARGWADRLTYMPVFCQATLPGVVRAYPQMKAMMPTRARQRLDRRACRAAANVIFESANQRQQFEAAYGPRKQTTIHNAAELHPDARGKRSAMRQRFGIPDDAFVVGFAGRPGVCGKDAPFMLEAAAASLDASGRVLFVGDGPGRKDVEARCEQLGLTARTVWAGWLDEPAEAYAAMDVLVMPSRFEIFGNVIVEAMGCGVPVIGRRRTTDPDRPILVACDELIDDGRTGFVVDPHDPAELAERLATLQADRARCRTMGDAAFDHVAGRPWSEVIDAYLEVMGVATGEATPAGSMKRAA